MQHHEGSEDGRETRGEDIKMNLRARKIKYTCLFGCRFVIIRVAVAFIVAFHGHSNLTASASNYHTTTASCACSWCFPCLFHFFPKV